MDPYYVGKLLTPNESVTDDRIVFRRNEVCPGTVHEQFEGSIRDIVNEAVKAAGPRAEGVRPLLEAYRATLNEIRFSSMMDFASSLEWGQWCRDKAMDALENMAQH